MRWRNLVHILRGKQASDDKTASICLPGTSSLGERERELVRVKRCEVLRASAPQKVHMAHPSSLGNRMAYGRIPLYSLFTRSDCPRSRESIPSSVIS